MITPIYCIVCRKAIRAGSRMVHMRTDARVFIEDFSSQVSPSNDQGWFEVGPNCYRKVVKAGRSGFRLD